ncbi:hypothetical protein PSTG_19961 [Puccinia striiformis f. sp. tritici PST-78]|uniref:Uncharacterized protein n=1 Tax=Puccinia striiformis f. sp. tritici PST-78 TaxID=1165861 RepID=A0A0L0UIB0_9BASI|nr:hypothetical protein PSTG_19961 [Puccinia striiformis f. sp. tritici PST-78]
MRVHLRLIIKSIKLGVELVEQIEHLAEKALYSGQAGTRDRGSSNTNRSSTAQAKSKLGQKSNAPPRHTGFELNIDQATLLGRRNKLPTPIE